jgi:tRNA nucleotidyltransferase (CCA-adding enzyme)
MLYAEQLRAALAASDWQVLCKVADLAARLNMSLYIVGGPVRDCLLQRQVSDLDLTTEDDAITLARIAARELGGTWKQFDRFGTAKLELPGRASPIDLATTRTETYAYPGALPDVTRGTIQTDLIRRDFTINAMAIRLDGEQRGQLIDLHSGKPDLHSGVLRVLHARSFLDDPTRLFRGARFAQRFGFITADDTRQLIPTALPVIDQLSGDRIRREFEIIFEETQPLAPLLLLRAWGVLSRVDPELTVDAWVRDRFEPCSTPYDRLSCWAWLTCRSSSSSLTRLCQRVNLSRDDTLDLEQIKSLWDAQETLGDFTRRSQVYHYLSDYRERALQIALTVIEHERAHANVMLYLNELREVKLAVDGTRLQQLGLMPGPLIGQVLAELRDAVLDGAIDTPQQQEDFVKRFIARQGSTS